MSKRVSRILAIVALVGFPGAIGYFTGYHAGWIAGKRGEYRAVYGSAVEKLALYKTLKDRPGDHQLRETLRHAVQSDVELLRVLGEQVEEDSLQRIVEAPVTWLRSQQEFSTRPLESVRELEARANKVLDH